MSSEDKPSARGGTAVLLTASLVSSLIMLDSNIVAVALPAIARSLHASFAQVEWVISAYVLTFASLLLPAGALADRFGRRRVMLVGLALFCAASAACGLATTASLLSASRAAQGAGGALLLTSSVAVLGEAFEGGPRRAKAWAFWGSSLGVAITAGPVVGGVLTTYLGWRWAFLVNVPACARLFVATRLFVRESSDPRRERPDWLGFVTFSGALGLLTWSLIALAEPAPRALTVGRPVAAAVLAALFVRAERRHPRPLVDLALFANRSFLGGSFAMLGYAAGAQVLLFYLPLYLQSSFGWSPLRAGLGMLPFALPLFVMPRLAGKLSALHPPRTVLALGMTAVLAGDLALALASRALSYPYFALAMLVAGCGAGILNGETTKAQVSAAPVERAGVVSGIAATTRFVGLLVAISVVGAVLSRGVARGMRLPGLDESTVSALARRVVAGDAAGAVGLVAPAQGEAVGAAAREAFASAFAGATLVCAGVSAVTLALVLRLFPRRAGV